MKNWFKQSWNNLFVRCPKTNKILGVNYKDSGKLLLPLLGILSIIWIFVRLLPKPSRAGYPCMRVAVPIASGFVLYVSGLLLSIVAFKKARDRFRNHK